MLDEKSHLTKIRDWIGFYKDIFFYQKLFQLKDSQLRRHLCGHTLSYQTILHWFTIKDLLL